MLEPQANEEKAPVIRRLDQPRNGEGRNHTPLHKNGAARRPDHSEESSVQASVVEKREMKEETEEKKPREKPAETMSADKDARVPRIMEFFTTFNIKWDDIKPELKQKLIILAETKDLPSFNQQVFDAFDNLHAYINPDNPKFVQDYITILERTKQMLDGIKQGKVPPEHFFKALAGYSGEPIPVVAESKDAAKSTAVNAAKPEKKNMSFLDKIIKGIDDFLEGILRFLGLSSNNPPKTATGAP